MAPRRLDVVSGLGRPVVPVVPRVRRELSHRPMLPAPRRRGRPRRWPPPTRPPPARARAAAARRARGETAARTPRGVANRRGSRTPSPAQSTREAFSAMSPTAGQTTTGQPLASARTSVPWPPWQTTRSHSRHRLRVGQPRHEHRVARARRPAGRARARSRWRSRAPARPPGPPAPRAAAGARGSCAVEGATSTTGPSPGGGSTRSPGGSHISGPTTRAHDGQSRGYSSCGSVATSVSARESTGVHVRQRRQPEPRAALVVLVAPLLEPARDQRGRSCAPQQRAPSRVRGSRAPIA